VRDWGASLGVVVGREVMTDIGQEANKPRIVEERNQGTEKPWRERPLREKPLREKPSREKPSREKPLREKLGT